MYKEKEIVCVLLHYFFFFNQDRIVNEEKTLEKINWTGRKVIKIESNKYIEKNSKI